MTVHTFLSTCCKLACCGALGFAIGCQASQTERADAHAEVAAAVLANDKKVLSAEDAVLVSVTARVQSINLATRQVTLKGPLGNVATFTVDPRVTRLAEIAVGDEVVADYYIALAAEVRRPTADEAANPLTVVDAAGKAPAGTQPAAGEVRMIKAVVTVEGIDLPTRTLTVAGPMQNLFTLRVKNAANLSKLHLGDTIVVTYTEALAISLEKRPPKAAVTNGT